MVATKVDVCPSQAAPQQEKRSLSPSKRERRIQRLMWTFEVEGITTTREQAEKAVEEALSEPRPDF